MRNVEITTITSTPRFIGLNKTTQKTQTPQEESRARKDENVITLEYFDLRIVAA
jgi:hypothetical protein